VVAEAIRRVPAKAYIEHVEASLEAYLVGVNKLHGAEINGVAVAFVAPRTSESIP